MSTVGSQVKSGDALSGFFHPNPLIKKLVKVEERSDRVASYRGISRKCLYFLVCVGLGILLALALQKVYPMQVATDEGVVEISAANIIGVLVSLVVVIVGALLAFLIRRTIPVTGALYCICTGYLYTVLPMLFDEYASVIGQAAILTIAVVVAMALLYSSGLINVNRKFRTVVSVLFGGAVVSGLLIGICYLIPATRHAASFIVENPLIAVVGSVVYILIAACFLLVDFNTIETTVEDGLPKKYEWYAAFSLAFSVIWIFARIVELLINLKNLKD